MQRLGMCRAFQLPLPPAHLKRCGRSNHTNREYTCHTGIISRTSVRSFPVVGCIPKYRIGLITVQHQAAVAVYGQHVYRQL